MPFLNLLRWVLDYSGCERPCDAKVKREVRFTYMPEFEDCMDSNLG